MKSIKKRLMLNFMFIIVVTVLVMEVFLIGIVRQNNYKNLEESLYNQVKYASDLYLRYFSDATLHENVMNNVDTFWKQTTAQVEIIDSKGNVLMDSIGVLPTDISGKEDVQRALQGSKGVWIGKVSYDTENVMAVSYPLRNSTEIVGALRFIVSLREVNRDIRRIATIFTAYGIFFILFSTLISVFLANSIIGPLKEVTATAEKMAAGDYKAESKKRVDDEIGRLSDTLNYMAREILKKEQLKNDFISSVSHELRTPLTSIKGWAVTLKHGYEDREVLMGGLDIIEKESDRLTDMVEELLDFSKFVSGKITLEKKPVDMAAVAEHLHRQLEPRALRDNIDFRVSVNSLESGWPVTHTDENRLKQVFINLLDNAFKFTPSGGMVSMDVSYESGWFNFLVKDTGSGIAEEELPKVTEKFYKGKSSKSTNGIGLSICDEIVKLMNGTMEIRSRLNEGTEVYVSIPLQERG